MDLLQFHWQFVSVVCHLVRRALTRLQYDDAQYIQALRLLQGDSRISRLGLCNFDTKTMEDILSAGVKIVSNQVQVSVFVHSVGYHI